MPEPEYLDIPDFLRHPDRVAEEKASSSNSDLLSSMGFEKCEFGPEPGDECERCDTENVQLYYRRTSYWEEEGDYWCADCAKKEAEEADAWAKKNGYEDC